MKNERNNILFIMVKYTVITRNKKTPRVGFFIHIQFIISAAPSSWSV
tara:strand:- start:17 stop:157 length:141 start_codon:yes stop_codon:yes gene_type:complete